MKKDITINESATSKNDIGAEKNRNWFKQHQVLVFNMISSPGSGKTLFLEQLGKLLGPELAVITGDIKTTLDADRINQSGAQAIQIETAGACHLTAQMINETLPLLNIDGVRLLIIENVGNLVCPSTYDLGEADKIAVLSVTEGDEKPRKYPELFTRSKYVLINKIDLLPHVQFNIEAVTSDCKTLNPNCKVHQISAQTAHGVSEFLNEIMATQYAH